MRTYLLVDVDESHGNDRSAIPATTIVDDEAYRASFSNCDDKDECAMADTLTNTCDETSVTSGNSGITYYEGYDDGDTVLDDSVGRPRLSW